MKTSIASDELLVVSKELVHHPGCCFELVGVLVVVRVRPVQLLKVDQVLLGAPVPVYELHQLREVVVRSVGQILIKCI